VENYFESVKRFSTPEEACSAMRALRFFAKVAGSSSGLAKNPGELSEQALTRSRDSHLGHSRCGGKPGVLIANRLFRLTTFAGHSKRNDRKKRRKTSRKSQAEQP
jgi:hypothetical protein